MSQATHHHVWQQRPGKPTRCIVCRRPVLPWWRRWHTHLTTWTTLVRENRRLP